VKTGKLEWVEDGKPVPHYWDGGAPAVHGTEKLGKHRTNLYRPKPYEDVKAQLAAIEDAGKLTPEITAYGKYKLRALKNQNIKPVDFDKIGHPLERNGDDPVQ